MSLRAILEVVVHLDTFRNIDLFFQGLYYVKVSVYNKKGDEVSRLTCRDRFGGYRYLPVTSR